MEHLDTETLKFSMVTETQRVLAKLPVKIVRVHSFYKKKTHHTPIIDNATDLGLTGSALIGQTRILPYVQKF